MRNSDEDNSQRLLYALMPGTKVDIYSHTRSSENIICLYGRMDVILIEEKKVYVQLANASNWRLDAQDVMCCKVLVVSERIHLCPENESWLCSTYGTWHTVHVYDPSVYTKPKRSNMMRMAAKLIMES